MHYQITRNGQMYGPYTMEDLQRYVASGHILPTDLAKSEQMAEWIPVSQLLAGASGFTAPSTGPTAYGAYAPPAYPPTAYGGGMQGTPANGPPDLHWGLVLLFDLLTCSLFQMVWNIILGAWFKRVVPGSKTLILYIASAVLIVMQAVMGNALGLMNGHHGYSYGYHYGTHTGGYGIYGLVAIVCWVVRLIARFTFRSELEQHYNTVEPIGLRLNPVLTFFFGGIYIQSQMNRINQIKRYGQPYRQGV